MRISDFLREENLVLPLRANDKEGVLKELCDHLSSTGFIENSGSVLDAVLSRERLGSTGVGDSVAIPHAKTKSVSSLVAAFGVCDEDVEFNSVDGKPVRLVFMLLATEGATAAHLKALARISRLLKNKVVREAIKKAKTPGEAYGLIMTEDETLG